MNVYDKSGVGMKFEPDKCPECGGEPVGTVESLLGVAGLTPDGRGGYDYDGYSEIWWDESRTVTDDQGCVALLCESDHEWYAVKI